MHDVRGALVAPRTDLSQNDRPVAPAQSRLRRANLLLPARPSGGPKRFIEGHTISSRDAIGKEAFLGRSSVTSTEKMENMFLGADTVTVNMNK